MRLTRKINKDEIMMYNPTRPENDKFVETDYMWKRDAYDRDLVNKLGQLEDIEDELGIDLITLFKANLEGIYLKDFDGKSPVPVMIRMGEITHTITLHTFNHLEKIMLKPEDYGKTWALTKEELE